MNSDENYIVWDVDAILQAYENIPDMKEQVRRKYVALLQFYEYHGLLNKKISNENGEIIDFIIKNHDRTPKGKLLSFGSKSPVRKWLSSKGSNSNPPNLKKKKKSLLEINGDE